MTDAFEQGLTQFVLEAPSTIAFFAEPGHATVAPQGTASPYWTFQLVSANEEFSLRGPANLVNVSYQLTVWAQDSDVALQAAKSLRTLLNGYRGWWGACRVQRSSATITGSQAEADSTSPRGYWHSRIITLNAWIEI